MKSYQAKAPADPSRRSYILVPIAIGGCAFLVGAVMTYGYVKWNSQKQQLAFMTEMVERMGQQQKTPAIPDTVTRSEPIDLLTLGKATIADEVEPIAPALAAETPVVDAPVESTADKLRSLVTASTVPAPILTLDDKAIADARRLETLAIIQAGVQELVTAVVKDEYDIHTNYEDEDFSGRIHFAFVGHEEDQKELESFLAQAAESGVVAHSASVVDGDGSVNGHILLFDLVERALENGTLEEQRAGEKMRSAALALLAKDETIGQAANAAGERFYTVEAGDSLAYIALQFYGNTDSFVRIFEANRNQLRTPDRIRVGQRLLIPSA